MTSILDYILITWSHNSSTIWIHLLFSYLRLVYDDCGTDISDTDSTTICGILCSLSIMDHVGFSVAWVLVDWGIGLTWSSITIFGASMSRQLMWKVSPGAGSRWGEVDIIWACWQSCGMTLLNLWSMSCIRSLSSLTLYFKSDSSSASSEHRFLNLLACSPYL